MLGKITAVLLLATLAACSSELTRGPDATPSADTGRLNEDTEWYLHSISDDGRTIRVVYTLSGVASGCQKEGGARAAESAETVMLTAWKSVSTDTTRACTEELGYFDAEVRLDSPLEDRALVGCRPPRTDPDEDRVCRDLQRSRDHGVFEVLSPPPA